MHGSPFYWEIRHHLHGTSRVMSLIALHAGHLMGLTRLRRCNSWLATAMHCLCSMGHLSQEYLVCPQNPRNPRHHAVKLGLIVLCSQVKNLITMYGIGDSRDSQIVASGIPRSPSNNSPVPSIFYNSQSFCQHICGALELTSLCLMK